MVSTAAGSSAKLDSLENNYCRGFRMIGLTKIPRIEFLLLLWIYRSIQIMTVYKIIVCIEDATMLRANNVRKAQV